MKVDDFLKTIYNVLGEKIWWKFEVDVNNAYLRLFDPNWQSFRCVFKKDKVEISGWPLDFNNSIVDETSAKNVLYDAAWEYTKWLEKNHKKSEEIYNTMKEKYWEK